MRRIRTYGEVGSAGGGDILAQVEAQAQRVARRLGEIRHVVAIGSGKGGVGKSVVSANLAAALVRRGHRVGVLDADLNGPSAALMLGAARAPLTVTADGVVPAGTAAGPTVMSMDLLLATPDTPVRWREPDVAGFVWQSTLETGALREFLADTIWGPLDYLIIDLPPGTDRMARLFTLVPQPAALLLVTTPAAVASAVVARSVAHARASGVRNIALISNMDGHVCAHCGEATPLFAGDGDAGLAARARLPLWGRIPFDPALGRSADAGVPLVISAPELAASRALEALAGAVEQHVAVEAVL
jgi:ATP-binding protein involved in chromosome partitioning